MRSPIHEGYRLYETKSDYGGVPQRGLVVESKELRKPLASGLSDVFCGGSESWPGDLPPCPRDLCLPGGCEGGHRSVRRRTFGESSSADRYGDRRDGPLWQAWQARQGSRAQRGPYRIKADLERDEAAIAEKLEHSGRYILATNVLKLKGDELLTECKGRQSVERSFRFLKEPLFFASSVLRAHDG